MEFHEIPERLRERLIEVEDCWVPSNKYRANIATARHEGKTIPLRRKLWLLSGREKPRTRYLLARCGNLECMRPDHCQPSPGGRQRNRKPIDRARYKRMHKAEYRERWDLEAAIKVLRRRGYTECRRVGGSLPPMQYRIGIGRGFRRGAQSREAWKRGPWTVRWMDAYDEARTLAAAGRAVQSREAA